MDQPKNLSFGVLSWSVLFYCFELLWSECDTHLITRLTFSFNNQMNPEVVWSFLTCRILSEKQKVTAQASLRGLRRLTWLILFAEASIPWTWMAPSSVDLHASHALENLLLSLMFIKSTFWDFDPLTFNSDHQKWIFFLVFLLCAEPNISVGSVMNLRTDRWFDPQYSFPGLMTVIMTGFIPLSLLPIVSTMVLWGSSQWLGKNIVLIKTMPEKHG